MPSSCIVDKQGRITLPSSWRSRQGIGPSSELVATEEEDRLIIQTREQRVRKAQRLVARYAVKGVSQVDELLRERREQVRIDREQ